jgi:hypothetical protein
MKLQRSTLVLVMLACVVGTGYGIYQLAVVPRQEKVELQATKLFDWQEDQVQKLSLQTPTGLLIFERRSETVPTPWQMLKPQETLASDASISFLLNLLSTQSSESTLTISRDRLAEFGLVKPLVTIGITLEDQTIHQMLLGNPDFSGNSLYALVDPDPNAADVEIRVVSNQFQFGTNRDLAEWVYTEPPEPEASPDALEPDAPPEVPEPEAEGNNDPPVTPE